MIPTAFHAIAPATTVGELFGPLAPLAVLGVVAGLAIVLALVAVESRANRQRGRAGGDPARAEDVAAAPTVRPAA